MTIGTLFTHHARYRPDHTAIIFEDKRLTYLELNQNINRLAKVVIMEDFPRNVAGKIVKREMWEPYWEGRNTKI